MKKAVFLDRDGVINRDQSDYTFKIEDFEILPGVFEAMKDFTSKGYDLIIITNQGGIAKKLYSIQDVNKLHDYLIFLLLKQGIILKDILFCPHHDSISRCICRKPDSQLLEKALAVHKINPLSCYFIGDNERDIIAGKKAGVNVIKVEPNSNLFNIVGCIP